MGSNKRDLKAYVRIDGSGRVVAGSLVLRRKMPKVGKWMEIQAYECCNPTTTTTTTSSIPVSDFRLKDNITATGNFVAGLPEYTWTWNSTAVALGVDNHPTTGVLAQEALLLYPEFVVFDTTIGYYRVNYEELAKA
jgi:hypothetical protein